MGFIAFVTPAVSFVSVHGSGRTKGVTVLAWTVWGLAVFIVVNAVVVQSFRQACKAYYEYKLAMYRELHRQSQEDADEVSSLLWERMK